VGRRPSLSARSGAFGRQASHSSLHGRSSSGGGSFDSSDSDDASEPLSGSAGLPPALSGRQAPVCLYGMTGCVGTRRLRRLLRNSGVADFVEVDVALEPPRARELPGRRTVPQLLAHGRWYADVAALEAADA